MSTAVTTGLAIANPNDQPATIELIDVGGRRIWSRSVGSLGVGRHSLAVPNDRARNPGVYFLRLSSNARSASTKVVITD